MVAIKTLKLHEQVAQHKTTAKVAAAYETSTHRGAKSSMRILVPLGRENMNNTKKISTSWLI